MNFKELNDDRRMLNNTMKVDRYVDRGFSNQAKSLVTKYAVCGGIALALPLLGVDNVIYAILLWSMYAKLCTMANKSFGSNITKSFIGAFVVNLLVSSLFELLVSMLPGVNLIGGFLIGYLSIKISGAAFLKSLEILHKGDVTEKYDISNVFSNQQKALDTQQNYNGDDI